MKSKSLFIVSLLAIISVNSYAKGRARRTKFYESSSTINLKGANQKNTRSIQDRLGSYLHEGQIGEFQKIADKFGHHKEEFIEVVEYFFSKDKNIRLSLKLAIEKVISMSSSPLDFEIFKKFFDYRISNNGGPFEVFYLTMFLNVKSIKCKREILKIMTS